MSGANPKRHRLAERGDDSYPTPPCAVTALLQVEALPHYIWEPACGAGNIVSVLRAAGHCVVASDPIDRSCPDSEFRIDFLMERRAPDGVAAIVTNPPYKLAAEFVVHALDLVPRVVMLLRLQFLELETAQRHPRQRPPCPRSRFQKQIADDAPRGLGRPAGVEFDRVRLVLLGSAAYRPGHFAATAAKSARHALPQRKYEVSL